MFSFFYQNSPIKKGLSIVLTITILSLAGGWILLYPKPVQAIFADYIGGPTGVVKFGWEIAKAAYEKVATAYNSAANWISANLELSKEAREMIAKAARIAATIAMHQVLNMMTNQIVEWIQGGGTPQFVSDWKSFLSDAFDKAGGLFVDKYLGMGYLCESFDLSVKIALLPVPVFEERVACSISDIIANVSDFANDFNQGSWKGWIELTKSENTFYGGYFASREEKLERAEEAREAALNEAASAGGFLSVKKCIEWDDDGECVNERVVTPGTAIADITSEVIGKDYKLLQAQIADMTDSLGSYAPYIITIANALINRVIQEGFAAVQSTGSTTSNPSAPLPAGTTVPPVDQTPTQVVQDQGNATSLFEQQKLLKENIETQLLSQQQDNLSVMKSIESIQINILTTLKDILFIKSTLTEQGIQNAVCSLPSWASSQTSGTNIQITASGVGNALLDGITYQIQSITPQISSQITIFEEDIIKTNQWIADTTAATASTVGYNQVSEEYLELYQTTLQPPTAEEQTALNQKIQLMNAAREIAISNGQLAAQSFTSTDSFFVVNTGTQNASINAIARTTNLLQARGMSEEYPQDNTLYAQKKLLQTKLSEAQSSLSNCNSNND